MRRRDGAAPEAEWGRRAMVAVLGAPGCVAAEAVGAVEMPGKAPGWRCWAKLAAGDAPGLVDAIEGAVLAVARALPEEAEVVWAPAI
ncbi:MAG: hypothetical protein K6U87_06070 [Firmicutes bacterium]|nr:hypothetical protein [Bacillota bacterium]